MIRKKREEWFSQWLNIKSNPNQNDVLQFHQFAGDGNKNNDLVMKRGEMYRTVSITSIELGNKTRKISYYDLNSNETFHLQTQI